MRAVWVIMLAVLVLVAGACGDTAECQPGQACELRGYEWIGGELWAFQACGSSDLIAVNIKGFEPGIEKLNAAIADLATAAGCPDGSGVGGSDCPIMVSPYVEVTASVSAPGEYSNLCHGKCDRMLDMLEIQAASASGPSDCAKITPDFR
jgi:hypothetical protein